MRKRILFSKLIGVSLALGVMVNGSGFVKGQEINSATTQIKKGFPSESEREVACAIYFSLRAWTQPQFLTALELLAPELLYWSATDSHLAKLPEPSFFPHRAQEIPASENFQHTDAFKDRRNNRDLQTDPQRSDSNERMENLIHISDPTGPIPATEYDRRELRRRAESHMTWERIHGGIGP